MTFNQCHLSFRELLISAQKTTPFILVGSATDVMEFAPASGQSSLTDALKISSTNTSDMRHLIISGDDRSFSFNASFTIYLKLKFLLQTHFCGLWYIR